MGVRDVIGLPSSRSRRTLRREAICRDGSVSFAEHRRGTMPDGTVGRSLIQARDMGGKVDLVVVAAAREGDELGDIIGGQGAASGSQTRPFSMVAVWACRRMILSPSGRRASASEPPEWTLSRPSANSWAPFLRVNRTTPRGGSGWVFVLN